MYTKLLLIDPVSACRIHKNDTQRLLRALEVFYISGKNLTELTCKNNYRLPYNVFQFAIIPQSKEWLNSNIKLRIQKMLSLRFQKEVETLFFRGDLNINLPSMRCIGYKQMWQYLEYKISYQEMCSEIFYATKKLSKHQLTWLKKWSNVYRINASESFCLLVKKILNIVNIS